MGANKKNRNHSKFIYVLLCIISLSIFISGCGEGSADNGFTGGAVSNNLHLNENFSPMPTCKYPEMLAVPLPFDIPEIPRFPNITSYGNKYHVDKDRGSNSNDGSSQNPWATLEYGVNHLTAGDTLIVHGVSTGYNERVYISNAGTNENWITIKGAPGENVILKGRLTFNSPAEYILFKNIDIQEKDWDLVDISTDSHHIAFDNVEINCQSGINNYTGVWVDEGVKNVWFKDMKIHHCGYMKENPTDPSGIYMKSPSNSESLIDNITFINVHVRDNKGDGIGGVEVGSVFFDGCVSSNNSGDGYDVGAKNISVFKNSVSTENRGDQGNGFKIWSKEAWLVNCHTYHNDYPGVVNKPKDKDSNIYILNSSFIDDNQDKYGGEIRIVNLFSEDIPDLSLNKVFLYNNIFHIFNTAAVVFEDISNQMLAGENNNFYFSSDVGIAFEFRDNKVGDRSYSITDMGDGTWYAAEGFGEYDIGEIFNSDTCQLN